MIIDNVFLYKNFSGTIEEDNTHWRTRYIMKSKKLPYSFTGDSVETLKENVIKYIDQALDDKNKSNNIPLTESEISKLKKKLENCGTRNILKQTLIKEKYIGVRNSCLTYREICMGVDIIKAYVADGEIIKNISREFVNSYNTIYYIPILIDSGKLLSQCDIVRISDKVNGL